MGPKAIIAIHKAIKIDPILKPKPVNLWKIESTEDKTFLWILRCGDKGLLFTMLLIWISQFIILLLVFDWEIQIFSIKIIYKYYNKIVEKYVDKMLLYYNFW